ncbi:uncharacterized protein F5147DRAFT_685611 [Suillus discolor]|uniref:Uncharacterized protein n=1 Tax=Suillus discolor TaxID=1912936 RepID=A0A9P7FC71_9AGAM|nr:uncharacterized protein F5147DRAFT_685611 [Suillus discolor]KAG2111525.1 hypothetical protein F5147DRAFT_685611 [Suillus discolor]
MTRYNGYIARFAGSFHNTVARSRIFISLLKSLQRSLPYYSYFLSCHSSRILLPFFTGTFHPVRSCTYPTTHSFSVLKSFRKPIHHSAWLKPPRKSPTPMPEDFDPKCKGIRYVHHLTFLLHILLTSLLPPFTLGNWEPFMPSLWQFSSSNPRPFPPDPLTILVLFSSCRP